MGWGNDGNITVGNEGLRCVAWIQLCLMHSDDKGILRVKTDSVVRYEGKLVKSLYLKTINRKCCGDNNYKIITHN